MTIAWAMALQAATAASPAPIDFDLARYRPQEPGCGEGDGSEIVVCGRRRNKDAQVKFDPRWVDKPLKAETGLGGGATIRVFVDSAEMPGGQVSKRGMVGIRLPF